MAPVGIISIKERISQKAREQIELLLPLLRVINVEPGWMLSYVNPFSNYYNARQGVEIRANQLRLDGETAWNAYVEDSVRRAPTKTLRAVVAELLCYKDYDFKATWWPGYYSVYRTELGHAKFYPRHRQRNERAHVRRTQKGVAE